MKTLLSKCLTSTRGTSMVEAMVALAMTGLIAAASFSFYSRMHGQAEVQVDLSEAQHIARNSLREIRRSTRMAGYKLSGHAPYAFTGDTNYVFAQLTQPVDTVMYYITPYSDDELEQMVDPPEGTTIYMLMKKVNSDDAVEFADLINDVTFTVVDTSTVRVSITAQTPRSDEDYELNSGYRTFTLSARIDIRNLN